MFGLERSKQYILGVVVDRRMAASLTVRGGRQQTSLPSTRSAISHSFSRWVLPAGIFLWSRPGC